MSRANSIQLVALATIAAIYTSKVSASEKCIVGKFFIADLLKL